MKSTIARSAVLITVGASLSLLLSCEALLTNRFPSPARIWVRSTDGEFVQEPLEVSLLVHDEAPEAPLEALFADLDPAELPLAEEGFAEFAINMRSVHTDFVCVQFYFRRYWVVRVRAVDWTEYFTIDMRGYAYCFNCPVVVRGEHIDVWGQAAGIGCVGGDPEFPGAVAVPQE